MKDEEHRSDAGVASTHKLRAAMDELTSTDPDFVLDYEEVFLNSNLPQLLASTAGRIIAWNSFFLKVTGMTEGEIEGATIFSLVKPSKLSNLFEIVAASLKKTVPVKETESSQEGKPQAQALSSSSDSTRESTLILLPCTTDSTKESSYAAVTLPCSAPSTLFISGS